VLSKLGVSRSAAIEVIAFAMIGSGAFAILIAVLNHMLTPSSSFSLVDTSPGGLATNT
jgi:hypothetical protein